MDKAQRVLLIRHGQTDWNMDGRWQGVLPIGLNDEGRRQAQSLARHLQKRPLTAVACSDLPRALDTALALTADRGIEPLVDQRWREFDLGVFQGLTKEEIGRLYPAEWQALSDDYWDYVVPLGESRRALQTRAYSAFLELTRPTEGRLYAGYADSDTETVGDLAVVTHGGVIRVLLLKIGVDQHILNQTHIENTSITTLVRHEGGWRVEHLGQTPHLRDDTHSQESL